MVTLRVRVTRRVVMAKLAELAPAAIVTLTGAVAIVVLLLARLTTAPPVGAGPLRVTVPVDGEPPLTIVGLSVSELSTAGGGVSAAPTFMVALALELL